MSTRILDTSFNPVCEVDSFESFIWTDRYSSEGDFEIDTISNSEIDAYCQEEYYIERSDSEHLMIVESKNTKTDFEKGDQIIISGRSLESILDRRIVWEQTILSGKLQTEIKRLLTQNVISPSLTSRKIDNFIFKDVTDSYIDSITIDAQYTGDYLLDILKDLCVYYEIGFKIVPDENYNFVFSLFNGADRSYDQEDNPYVVFSPRFENLSNSEYIHSLKPYKNVAQVAGEGEGSERKKVIVEPTAVSGLSRRELFVDARDLSSTTDGKTLSTTEYNAQLTSRGNTKLAENIEVETFDGEADTTRTYRYNEDFYMGDIVQVADEYGNEAKSRVTEVIYSVSTEGSTVVPTFEAI